MPNLPTIEVSTEQADIILNAFGGEESYCDWLRERVREQTLLIEGRAIDEEHNTAKVAALTALDGDLTL